MKSVNFRLFYHGINYHARISFGRTVAEPVFSAQGYLSDRVFRWVVALAAPSVFEIRHQRVFSISDISHCTIHTASLFLPLCIQPADKAFHYRFFIFQATIVYLGIGQSFCFIAPLIFESPCYYTVVIYRVSLSRCERPSNGAHWSVRIDNM